DGAITRIRLEKIVPSEIQPRQNRTSGIEDLAASIAVDGLLSPIVVTRHEKGYRIIAGERRYHALKLLKKQDAECRIISREERDYFRIAIIENLQRENLSPQEEALALKQLKTQEKYSDEELSKIIGKSRNYITEILGIASLPEEELEECRKAGISSRNMMIQVVQAHKKGTFQEFLKDYRDGKIRTVKDARSFLGKDEGRAVRETEKKSSVRKKETELKLTGLERSGSKITLDFRSEKDALSAETWILKRLNDFI
ncbi:MAG: ParB/RepB/Spo0J family partition protein, partial [Spirochaetia bacterium]|nr:ParB/RepB/Spo0J family partition protein [Spirochaetia bacterium]